MKMKAKQISLNDAGAYDGSPIEQELYRDECILLTTLRKVHSILKFMHYMEFFLYQNRHCREGTKISHVMFSIVF